ncbi:ABC transporter permease [Arenimonas sp.]|uniref:ABC transporter permease n=1 Tax=Arenimonas sp. TaxID=1872635 RepID=UPI0039E2C381
MQALIRFSGILRADLRERIRGPRFWVLLAIVMVAAWWCFPPASAGYRILSMNGGERGFYSSAWVGMVLAMVYSSLLSLGGFYVIRGTLVRDIETRVWQLLVATPMTRGAYLLAKWASHMLVLAAIALVGLGVGLVAQWLRAEDRAIDLIELLKPVLVLSIPGLAVTAMLAIWFDLLPWLRRTAGNVVFFILWVTLTSVSLAQLESPDNHAARYGWGSDPNGMIVAARDFQRERSVATGERQDFGFSIGVSMRGKPATRFEWKAWHPRGPDMFGRLLWLLFAMAGVVAAAPLLDWAAARGIAASKSGSQAGRRLGWLDPMLAPFARGPLGTLVVAELKLAFRQRRLWWWLAAIALLGTQAFASMQGMATAMLLAWLLPLDVLARGVLREREHRTAGLVFTAPDILGRLLATRFLVGVLLLFALSLPGLLRLAAGLPMGALATTAAIVSIASWGMSLGALCRNPKPFELVLVALVYGGLQGMAIFDLLRDPLAMAGLHALLLLPAWLLLAWAWPRLATR